MTTAGRVLLLVLGLYLLTLAVLVPCFMVPQLDRLQLVSQREGVPARLPAMQSALLMLDVDRRVHRQWQVFATRVLVGFSLAALLVCGSMSATAALQWLRFPVDPFSHVRHFGLGVSAGAVVLCLLLVQLVARSASAGVRFLSLGPWGYAGAVAGLVILFTHKRLESTA